MTKSFFLLILLLPLGGGRSAFAQADSSAITQDRELLLQQIARDPDYHRLRQLLQESAGYVIEQAYDLDGLGVLFDRIEPEYFGVSACDIPDSLFQTVRGGLVFKDISCRTEKVLGVLNEKFSISNLTNEEYDQVRYYYQQYHKDSGRMEELLRNKAFQKLNRN